MAEATSFPYEIHPLANLGEMQEQAVLELMDDIGRYGFNPDFALKVLRGKMLDGRHRQEACLRLIARDGFLKLTDGSQVSEPPAEHVLPRGGAAQYVAQVNSLKTYRKIDTKARMIYAAENFTNITANQAQKLLGFTNGQYAYVLKAYKKSRKSKIKPNPWDVYKEGGSLKKLFEAFAIERNSGHDHGALKSQIEKLETDLSEATDDIQQAKSDVEMYQEMVEARDATIKELEKRVKSLDPQERIARAAVGDSTPEDRLRDRLEFTEGELKKARKLLDQFASKEKETVRLEHVVADVFSGLDWGARAIQVPVLDPTKRSRAHEFVAVMSDAHFGEFVNPSEALGISYNIEIAEARIQHYRDVVLKYKDLRSPSYDISKLTVAVLGDMLSGNIHEELANTNQLPISKQTAYMTRILRDIARDFAGAFPEVEFIIMPGNHPRVNKKPQNKQKFDNWEYVMGDSLALAMEEVENVTVRIPEDLFYVHEVFGQRLGMFHGDGVKSSSFAGIPFYGMRQRREAVQSLMNSRGLDRLDYLIMGHFHQYLYWEAECSILVNGAIKGGDEYSISTFMSAPDPVQVLLEFHPEHGLTAQERINFAHIN